MVELHMSLLSKWVSKSDIYILWLKMVLGLFKMEIFFIDNKSAVCVSVKT